MLFPGLAFMLCLPFLSSFPVLRQDRAAQRDQGVMHEAGSFNSSKSPLQHPVPGTLQTDPIPAVPEPLLQGHCDPAESGSLGSHHCSGGMLGTAVPRVRAEQSSAV